MLFGPVLRSARPREIFQICLLGCSPVIGGLTSEVSSEDHCARIRGEFCSLETILGSARRR